MALWRKVYPGLDPGKCTIATFTKYMLHMERVLLISNGRYTEEMYNKERAETTARKMKIMQTFRDFYPDSIELEMMDG